MSTKKSPCNIAFLGSFSSEEESRNRARLQPDPKAPVMWQQALSSSRNMDHQQILSRAYAYSGSIIYDHIGLSSEVYAAHPIRVAAMALLSSNSEDVVAGVVGLLHNVFEVTNISPQEIGDKFGKDIATTIEVLTVDRARQWEIQYKLDYYTAIEQLGRSAMRVKVLDKLDNLFLININPDQQIRAAYRSEIERHVIPMSEKVDPAIADYMTQLLNYTRMKDIE